MKINAGSDPIDASPADPAADRRSAVYPRSFGHLPNPTDPYFRDPPARILAEFFQAKGLAAIKDEDAREQWYDDWIAYQAEHRLYAAVLSPKQFSTLGYEFDLLRLTRFLEVFAYFSPAHGYSLQVTFLGLHSILMGTNTNLQREAVAALEAGRLLAFGVSEKQHGSDLLGGEFAVREIGPDRFIANGAKYYIGNADQAAIISILARKHDKRTAANPHRAPLALIALRPDQSPALRAARKIRTLGVRAAYIGEFEVKNHELPANDFIAEGRRAWDAVLGTVTLGKFFLGFGSIGICEHALEEAVAHLSTRILYRKPALDMPHIRLMTAQAYARLTAMKLYAYRALDYLHAARETDRRYLLFCAIQKARVSTEGVKVMAQLSECVGAKGFESDTYFESALRDIQLIPGLEGSTHINLSQATQFIERYFSRSDSSLPLPPSLIAGEADSRENSYLTTARAAPVADVSFPHFLEAYEPIRNLPNVSLFVRQAKAFRFLTRSRTGRAQLADLRVALACGQCMAVIGYAQLIAESAATLALPPPMLSTIFHLLVCDLSAATQSLAALPGLSPLSRILARRLIAIPRTGESDWDFVSRRVDLMAADATGKPPIAEGG